MTHRFLNISVLCLLCCPVIADDGRNATIALQRVLDAAAVRGGCSYEGSTSTYNLVTGVGSTMW